MGAGIEHALRGLFDGGAVFVAECFASEAGPGVVVVDDGVGVAEITFQSSAGEAHEGVVHAAGHDAEVKQCGVINCETQITDDGFTAVKTYWDVSAPFR